MHKIQRQKLHSNLYMCLGITSQWLCLSRAVRSSVTKTWWSPSAVQVTGAMTALVSLRTMKKNYVIVYVELCINLFHRGPMTFVEFLSDFYTF